MTEGNIGVVYGALMASVVWLTFFATFIRDAKKQYKNAKKYYEQASKREDDAFKYYVDAGDKYWDYITKGY